MSVASSSGAIDPSQITVRFCRAPAGAMTSAGILRKLNLAAFGLDVLLTLLGALLTAGGACCLVLLRGHESTSAAGPAAVLTAAASTVAILCLTSGMLLVLVGLLGCCGVARSSRALLFGQAAALGFLLLLQVATLAVVIWSERSAPLRAELAALEMIRRRGSGDIVTTSSVDKEEKGGDPDSAPAWRAVHAVQRRLHCCGVLGYGDYASVNVTVPVSCCRDETPSAGTPQRCHFSGLPPAELRSHPLLQREGCGARVRRRVRLLAALVYVLCGVTLAVQMAALTVSCYLALEAGEEVPPVPAIHASGQSFRNRSRYGGSADRSRSYD